MFKTVFNLKFCNGIVWKNNKLLCLFCFVVNNFSHVETHFSETTGLGNRATRFTKSSKRVNEISYTKKFRVHATCPES